MDPIISIASLNSDPTTYVAVNRPCRLNKAISVVTTTVTTNETTLTLSDGTTTIGTITIAAGSTAGTIDEMSWAANVELDEDTPLKIVSSGTPGAGAVNVSLEFSQYHVG